jgi:putative copper export protein/mono/diheme cytochrome c family protein
VLIAGPALENATPLAGEAALLRRRTIALAWGSLAVMAASGFLWLVAEARDMSGQPLIAALSHGALGLVLTRTEFGHATLGRAAAAVLLAACLFVSGRTQRTDIRTPVTAAMLLLAAGLAGSLAMTGHAAVTDAENGGFLHLVSDIAHLLAAAAWLGALVPLGLFLARFRSVRDPAAAAVLQRVVARFSVVGIASVATLLVSGSVNTWFLAGTVPALIGTPYGQWLLAKIALFLAMVAVAAFNKFRLTPRLSHVPKGSRARESRRALGLLARNALIETGLGTAVILIVGLIGTLPPGLHTEPKWPLPFRFATELLSDPTIAHTAAIELAGLAAGILLMVGCHALRKTGLQIFRWPMFTLGLALAFYEAAYLRVFAVPAYPTSYDASPTGFSVASVAEGRRLFAANCTACHGASGRGDGPLAKSLPIPPADLTAAHVYAHLDGELFWWISHGLDNVMPGFAPNLAATEIWNLIDFVHANADAARFRAALPGLSLRYTRAPDFTVQCPGGAGLSLGRLRGRIVRIVLGAPAGADRAADLAALDRSAGNVVTVVVPLHGERTPQEVCVAPDPAIADAYGLYVGGERRPGTQFLIGAAGSLRGAWYPGLSADPGDDWGNPAVLLSELAAIASRPLAPAVTTPAHVHAH